MEYKECFSIFNSSYTDKEIPKDVLLNNIDNNEDKEIIERFVENLFLKYCINGFINTMFIQLSYQRHVLSHIIIYMN